MKKIVICVCTRRRKEGIIKLLSSLDKMKKPEGTNIEIIIVENDDKNYTENAIKEYANNSNLNIHYFLESKRGISYARNRTVQESGLCDFCCFVDDDQVVDVNWISELLSCQKEFNADAVIGVNPPIFEKKVPSYIRKFHEPTLFDYGYIVERAATNCLLIKKSWLNKIEGPFDHRLNFSGGEDMYLTSTITKLGGVIRFNPNAKAYENVPEDRLTIKFIIKRTFRIGNGKLIYRSLLEGKYYKYRITPRLILRLIKGIVLLIPCYLFGKEEKLKGLLKMVDACGGILFLFGKRNSFYKNSN